MPTEQTAALSRAGIDGVSRRYILVMLTLVYVVNYLDRNILNILLPAIKAEFHLTDADLEDALDGVRLDEEVEGFTGKMGVGNTHEAGRLPAGLRHQAEFHCPTDVSVVGIDRAPRGRGREAGALSGVHTKIKREVVWRN